VKNSRFFKDAKYGKKLRTLLRDLLADSNNVAMTLTMSVSAVTAEQAHNTSVHLSNFLKTTAPPEEPDELTERATKITMEGDKYLLGYGVHKSPEMAFKKFLEAASEPYS
jgi:hypothetical protein